MTLNDTLPFTVRLLLLITEISSGRDLFGMDRNRIIQRSTNDWEDESGFFLQKRDETVIKQSKRRLNDPSL